MHQWYCLLDGRSSHTCSGNLAPSPDSGSSSHRLKHLFPARVGSATYSCNNGTSWGSATNATCARLCFPTMSLVVLPSSAGLSVPIPATCSTPCPHATLVVHATVTETPPPVKQEVAHLLVYWCNHHGGWSHAIQRDLCCRKCLFRR